MNDLIALLIEYFRQYHIGILGLVLILQNNGIPLGSNFLVMAAGAFAFAGEFNLYLLGGQVLFFSLLGDSLSYLIWRRAGESLLDKRPRIDSYLRTGLGKVRNHFHQHGRITVLFSRFPLSAFNSFVNISAGLSRYRYLEFIATATVGEMLWVGFNLGVGYWFGDELEHIIGLDRQFGQITSMTVLLALMIYAIIRLQKNRSNRNKANDKNNASNSVKRLGDT